MGKGETIVLQIGQAGIQAGHSFWTQLCGEHGIAPDGVASRAMCDPNEHADSLFTPTARETYSPRAFCIDTDPGSLDWLQLSGYRDLYNPGQLISGNEDAAGCFARGYHKFGQLFCMRSREKIRRVLENCDYFQGFIVFRSLTGGTGSGLSSILMKRVNDDFLKKNVFSIDILPPSRGASTLDPYNVVLALHETMEVSDVSFLLSNESMFRIARDHMGVPTSKFHHVNQLVATVASHITNGLRFQSGLSLTLKELQTNLVPLPRLKYPVLAYSPICPPGRSVTDSVVSTIINNVFTPSAQLVPYDTRYGRYISALLMLRGDYQPDEVNAHISKLSNHPRTPLKFVDWIPPSVKYSMCTLPPKRPFGWDLGHVPRSVLAAMNNTGMEPVLRPFINSFRKLYCNKAFLHRYKEEGMEELDFELALQDMESLQEDFVRVSKEDPNASDPAAKGSKVPSAQKPCLEITIPREAFNELQLRKGCIPCRNLNLPLIPPLRIRGCNDCGPYDTLRCGKCGLKDFTLYGLSLQRSFDCPRKRPKGCSGTGNWNSVDQKSHDEIAREKKRAKRCPPKNNDKPPPGEDKGCGKKPNKPSKCQPVDTRMIC